MKQLRGQIEELARKVKVASRQLATTSTGQKNAVLRKLADLLDESGERIEAANAADLERGRKQGLNKAMLDRLALGKIRVTELMDQIHQVAELPDPIGRMIKEWTLPNGIRMSQVRVPIGVVGIIYESRPVVTIDASILCLKTGNGVILRGGKEALESNRCLASLIGEAARSCGFSPEVAGFVSTTNRAAIPILCELSDSIDLMIPRGGYGLIETVVNHARMPVIKHFQGICHVYVHEKADWDMAERIVVNAKCQRPGVCNAAETVLIDAKIAEKFAPRLFKTLRANGVKILGDEKTSGFVGEQLEKPESWRVEYLDLIMAMRIVDSLDGAVRHIETYGSRHSDAIVTEDKTAAEQFLREVDSAAVFWNASTRFTDGNQFGLGAEIGISTDKIHARGPMGLEGLTSYKYIARGRGQIRK